MTDRTKKRLLATAPVGGKPVDYAVAWCVSVNRARAILRELKRGKPAMKGDKQ